MNRISTMEFVGIADRGLKLFLAFILILFLYVPASAAEKEKAYPTKPITLIIPIAPGGILDMHGKFVGERLSLILQQPIVRTFKPGAGGAIGLSYVKKSKPDGYMWVVGSSSNMIVSPLVKKLDYTYEDFIPLGIYAKSALWLGVKTDSKWNTLDDFIRDAKKRPYELRVGSFGNLTIGEFVFQELCRLAGIKLTFIPFKGCARTMQALLGGHIEGYICATSMGQLKAGTVRVLAVADHERLPFIPGKTFKELGYPVIAPVIFSFFVSKETPKGIVDKISDALQEVYKQYGEELSKDFNKVESMAYFKTLEESRQLWKEDYERNFKIAKTLGVLAQ